MKGSRRGIYVCAIGSLLTGCTPEGFDVTPCQIGGQLAFRVHPIDGWFSDYVPRPSSVLVGRADGTHKWPGMWSAELKYYGDDKAYSKKLLVGNIVAYGQKLPGWELSQPAKALRKGHKYWVRIDSGYGHDGWAEFTAGQPLPPCS